jgi:hypothetical protein
LWQRTEIQALLHIDSLILKVQMAWFVKILMLAARPASMHKVA